MMNLDQLHAALTQIQEIVGGSGPEEIIQNAAAMLSAPKFFHYPDASRCHRLFAADPEAFSALSAMLQDRSDTLNIIDTRGEEHIIHGSREAMSALLNLLDRERRYKLAKAAIIEKLTSKGLNELAHSVNAPLIASGTWTEGGMDFILDREFLEAIL